MIRNELGFVANDNVRRWTKTAQNCYEQNLKADYTACYITNRIDEVLNNV